MTVAAGAVVAGAVDWIAVDAGASGSLDATVAVVGSTGADVVAGAVDPSGAGAATVPAVFA